MSNLTNLLAVERIHWTAATWARHAWAPAAVSVLVTVGVLGLRYRRDLRGRYHPDDGRPSADRPAAGIRRTRR